MWTLCCVVLTLLAASHQLSIDEFVVPASAEEGAAVELKCGYSLDAIDSRSVPYVKWWFTPIYNREVKPKLLYQRTRNNGTEERYVHPDLDWSGPKDNIVLKSAEYSDSGRYVCEVSAYDEKRPTADLIIFSNGTGPQLNISVVEDGPDGDEDEDLLVECHADDVTPEPELVISANGRPLKGVIQDVTPIELGLFSASANVTVTKSDLEGAEVRCELFFVNHNITHLPFVDVETYSSSGAVPSAEPELEAPPHNLTLLNSDPAPQINRSASRSVSWWLSTAAVLVTVLQSLIQTSN